jgi:hypothetical protein
VMVITTTMGMARIGMITITTTRTTDARRTQTSS